MAKDIVWFLESGDGSVNWVPEAKNVVGLSDKLVVAAISDGFKVWEDETVPQNNFFKIWSGESKKCNLVNYSNLLNPIFLNGNPVYNVPKQVENQDVFSLPVQNQSHNDLLQARIYTPLQKDANPDINTQYFLERDHDGKKFWVPTMSNPVEGIELVSELAGKKALVVGRARNNKVVTNEPTAADYHFTLWCPNKENTCYLANLSKGTLVNSRLLSGRGETMEVSTGDYISFLREETNPKVAYKIKAYNPLSLQEGK